MSSGVDYKKQMMAIGNVSLFLVGCLVMPLCAFIPAYQNSNKINPPYLWNVACGFNCLFLFIGSCPLTFQLIKLVVFKGWKKGEALVQPEPTKEAYWMSPAERIILRADIFQFTWSMCLKRDFLKELLQEQGTYAEFEYMSLRQFKQLYIAMGMCAGSVIAICSLLIIELT